MDIDFQTAAGMRELSKKVLVVITDGESTEVRTVQMLTLSN